MLLFIRLLLIVKVVWIPYVLLSQFGINVVARPDYPDKIPNGRNVKDVNGNSWIGVGHQRSSGSGPLNQFGEDFASAGFAWTEALCRTDSDGDGATNGEELGDPNCVWSEGDPPQSSTVSHPGFPGDIASGTIDTCKNFTAQANSINMTVQFNPAFSLPAGVVTTYPRQAFDLRTIPGSAGSVDHYAYRFEVVFGGPVDVVHHILLYSCTQAQVSSYLSEPKLTGGMPCSQGLVFGWAIAYCFPDGVALRLKSNKPWVLMEVHMNNAAGASGIQSAPGLKITALPLNQPQPPTPPKEANWLWLGANLNSIQIPPGQSYVELVSTINLPAAPSGTLQLIASLSHMHYLGRKVWVDKTPSSGSSVSLACNPKYDNQDQELLPITAPLSVTNDDTLVVHCVFNSTGRTNITRGGEETNDEMCFVFFLYISDQINQALQFTENAVTSTVPQDTATSCQAAGAEEDVLGYGSSPPAWVVAHAILGAVGFGFLMPLGTLFPASKVIRALPNHRWFHIHRGFVILGCIGGWSAFVIAIALVPVKFSTVHGKLGLAIAVLACCQVLLGVFRPHLPTKWFSKSDIRKIWEYIHPFLGRAIVVCCAAQMYLGYDLLNQYYLLSLGLRIWGWIHAVGVFGLWLLALVVFKMSAYRASQSITKTEDDAPLAISA